MNPVTSPLQRGRGSLELLTLSGSTEPKLEQRTNEHQHQKILDLRCSPARILPARLRDDGNPKLNTTMSLPKPIDIVRYRTWTGLTVAELFHAGRLGSDGADKRNIERITRQFHPPAHPLEYQALLEIANEAYEYLLDEQQIELQIQRANTYQ